MVRMMMVMIQMDKEAVAVEYNSSITRLNQSKENVKRMESQSRYVIESYCSVCAAPKNVVLERNELFCLSFASHCLYLSDTALIMPYLSMTTPSR